MPSSLQLHATCITLGGKGVLLLGKSGSGKSDVALRLIDGGATLLADDRVDIHRAGEGLVASAPKALLGLLEVRGIGILTVPYMKKTPLALAVNLVSRKAVERLPEPQFWDCLGLKLPLHSLHAFDDSVCAKIRLMLKCPILSS